MLIVTSAVRFEGLEMSKGPYPLINFRDPSSLESCKTMSDRDQSGFSTVNLDFVASNSKTEPPHAHFHGNISTKLPLNRPDIARSGYAAWRTRDLGSTIFGQSFWDIDPYTYLALRIKSDGRKYFVNLMTDTIVPTDIHQHRLHAQRPGEWETVLIQWNDFVRTSYGEPVAPQGQMVGSRLKSVGIGLTDGVPGPYELRVNSMWATNGDDVSGDIEENSLDEASSWERKLARNEEGLNLGGPEVKARL